MHSKHQERASSASASSLSLDRVLLEVRGPSRKLAAGWDHHQDLAPELPLKLPWQQAEAQLDSACLVAPLRRKLVAADPMAFPLAGPEERRTLADRAPVGHKLVPHTQNPVQADKHRSLAALLRLEHRKEPSAAELVHRDPVVSGTCSRLAAVAAAAGHTYRVMCTETAPAEPAQDNKQRRYPPRRSSEAVAGRTPQLLGGPDKSRSAVALLDPQERIGHTSDLVMEGCSPK